MSDISIRIGKRVRNLRINAKLSQETLAERSEISTKYLSDLERGYANVSVLVLEHVAHALGKSFLELLENDHEAPVEMLKKEIENYIKQANEEEIKNLYKFVRHLG